ncbi:hypothetical protein GCM10010842_29860 [Deinococcus daejeonensis]|uniref:Uncharacterized protein n=1 Tax=Deinococcus daejeonensis TaxID=1007098 RepID=A0ABQ2JA28_9DEIO|nr:hypothetical protein GCM10010842_29860 [Deinococcus daejeonensis]
MVNGFGGTDYLRRWRDGALILSPMTAAACFSRDSSPPLASDVNLASWSFALRCLQRMDKFLVRRAHASDLLGFWQLNLPKAQGCGLVASSCGGRDSGSGVAVKVRDSGVQGQKFLRSPPSFEAQLVSLLLPCRAMRLLHQVVPARGGPHLNVLHGVDPGEFP